MSMHQQYRAEYTVWIKTPRILSPTHLCRRSTHRLVPFRRLWLPFIYPPYVLVLRLVAGSEMSSLSRIGLLYLVSETGSITRMHFQVALVQNPSPSWCNPIAPMQYRNACISIVQQAKKTRSGMPSLLRRADDGNRYRPLTSDIIPAMTSDVRDWSWRRSVHAE